MEGRNKIESASEARKFRKKQRAKSRQRKAGAFIVLAAVAALLVSLTVGGLLQGKSSPSKAAKGPKHGYASVIPPDVGSNRVKAPNPYPQTLSNVAYQSIAPQLPYLSRKDIGIAHQSVLDPSWASIRVQAPDREAGYYSVFLHRNGKFWKTERSVLVDENTYPEDPDAVLRDIPRDLAKTLEFPPQTSGSASSPSDLAVGVIAQQTAEKGEWTAGKVRSSGEYYAVTVEKKKDKSKHTNVYLTGKDGLYTVVAIGENITSTEAPGFPKKLVKQEKASGSEKAHFDPTSAVIQGSIDQNSILPGLKSAQSAVEGYPGIAGFYAVDLKSGSGYGVRPNEEFFTASVIKVPVMIAVFRRIDEGKLSYKDLYKTKKEDYATGAGGLQWEPAGTPQTIEDYLWLMITQSDNVATNALTRIVGGREYVNQVAHSLGANDTTLYQKVSSERAAVPNLDNRSTPKDMATLLAKVYDNKAAGEQSCHEMIGLMEQNNLEFWMEAGVPPDVKVANKGGWIDRTYNDVGIVEYNNRPYVLAVFSKYGSDSLQDGGNMIALVSKGVWQAESGKFLEKSSVKKRAKLNPKAKR